MLQTEELYAELFHSRSMHFVNTVIRGIAVRSDQLLEYMDQSKCNHVKNTYISEKK